MLLSSERHSRERLSHARAVVVHVQLPGIGGTVVDERSVKAVGRAVVEEKGDRIARYAASAGTGGVEGARGRVVHPQDGVLAGLRVATEQHDGLVRRRALRVT